MRKIFIVLGSVILVLAGVAVWVALNPSSLDALRAKETVTDATAVGKTAVVFVRNPYKDDYQMSRIPGYVDNLTGTKLSKVDIEIQLADGDGNRKEVVKYTVIDVEPRSRKTFDANAGAISGPRRASVKVKSIEVVK